MTTNPFEDDSADYLVLVNNEQQHSIWPSGLGIPIGWTAVCEARPRQECLEYVETHWTDMRPAGIRGRE
ncbi:MbtH family NRPS accessory protein [Streptomyces sp. SID12501]|uniref:MbtH family NRPS accessory protein n=1 Tax=Streptomyces sp. SID12501 TaxID=2706042 RepID=A0A6B3C4R6_9ACTN|nr:MbtH family NRPS accessory protein [Streptomyces sp. SID12501]NEC91733.1 MbtH family NRPS accessory protein [Streptomyces sp. SID12501]